jgi:hypothetical protein
MSGGRAPIEADVIAAIVAAIEASLTPMAPEPVEPMSRWRLAARLGAGERALRAPGSAWKRASRAEG